MSRKTSLFRRSILMGSTALLALGTGATSISAQDADAGETEFEEVVVTGSRIKNANISSPSPVTSVGAQEIVMRGNTQIEDMLNILPQTVATNGDGNFAGTGTANVDLRGLGPNRTLVLVDGRRLPYGQGDSTAANLNAIPSKLVERVDVLTGGASAVYGADAVAGVVNFVMKRDFEGVSIDSQMSINQADNNSDRFRGILNAAEQPVPGSTFDGFTWSTDILVGANTADGRGNITASFGYREANEIRQNQRDYAACAFGQGSGADEYTCNGSSTSFPAHIFDQLGAYNIVAFDGTGLPRDYIYSGPGNDTFNYAVTQRTRAPSERFSASVFSRYELTDNIEMFMDIAYTSQTSQGQVGPSGSFGHGSGINCDNPFLGPELLDIICTSQGLSGDDVATTALVRRRNADGGARQYSYSNDTFRVSGGFRGDISDAWSYEVSGQYSRVKNSRYNENVIDDARVDKALHAVVDPATGNIVCKSVLDGSDPNCIPWDIYSPSGDPTAAQAYITPPTLETGVVTQKMLEATFVGDLGEYGFILPGAETGVQFVGGVARRIDHLDRDVDATLFDGGTFPTDEKIDVTEFFGELAIPILEGVELAEELTATAAYRWSDYSTTGPSTAWALGLTWTPVPDIRFRGQVQQAVRAPNVFELFGARIENLFDLTVGANGQYDPCSGPNPTYTESQCGNMGVTSAQYGNVLDNPAGQFNQFTGGNPDLDVETSRTYTFGAIFTPSFVEGLTVSVDYYDISVEGFIDTVPPQLAMTNCATNNDPYFCGLIQRDAGGGLWIDHDSSYIISTNLNTGSLKVKGLDFNIQYGFDMPDGWGDMNLSYVASYMLKSLEESLPGETPFDCAGKYAGQCEIPRPKYGHTMRADWNFDSGVNVGFTWRNIGKTNLFGAATDNGRLNYELKMINYFDISTSFDIAEGWRVRAGINNLFGTRPPVTDSLPAGRGTGNTFPALYDVDMRYGFLGFVADF